MRLIDADKLLKDIEQYHLSDGFFQHWVEVQPTIDDVVYGDGIDECNPWKCLNCTAKSYKNSYHCPNCGTKMDEEK